MTFTIMIPTRNRCRDLELTCVQLSKLEPAPVEVWICADGCTDETCAKLGRNFPQFKVLRNKAAQGSVYSRHRMLQSALGEIVVSLDDDSYPVGVDFLARLKEVFESHPEAAVVVFSELRRGSARLNPARSRGCYVGAYANCGAAMRRQVYLNQSGFPAFFHHMYEEPDYAAQCYAAGYGVWLEPSLEIFHRQSAANRRVLERHQLNARNELWSVWLRCPWPWLPALTAYRAARQLVHAFCLGPQCVIREPFWWWQAFKGMGTCLAQRHAIPWKTYRRWVGLARHPVGDLIGLRARFPESRVGPAPLGVRSGPRLKPQPVAAADHYCSP